MKVLGWIVAVPLIFFGLFVALRFAFCRPNYFVVKTATPVAERIADYIVEHGLPERLDVIPGLPYELKGCTRKEVYWRDGKQIKEKQKATTSEIYMSCNFEHRNKLLSKDEIYNIYLKYNSSFGEVDIDIMNRSSNTGTGYVLKKDKKSKFKIDFISRGYMLQHNGICRAFKQ